MVFLFISPTYLLFCYSFLLSAVNTYYIIFTKKNALSGNKLLVVTGIRKKSNTVQYFYQHGKEQFLCMKESSGGSEHKPSMQQRAESVGGKGDVS